MYRHVFRVENGEPLFDAKTWALISGSGVVDTKEIVELAPASVASDDAAPMEQLELTESASSRSSLQVEKRVVPELSSVHETMSGVVRVVLDVAPSGDVVDFSIVDSSDVDLNMPTLDAARNWKFKENFSNKAPVQVIVPFTYKGSNTALNLDRIPHAESVDSPPIAVFQAPIADEETVSGYANVEYIIDELGYVAKLNVVESSSPELAESLVASIRASRFQPALLKGKAIATRVSKSYAFGDVLGSQDGLDQQPEIVVAVKPKLRRSLQGVEGYVLMHLRIDETGRVVDARAMESSDSALLKPTREASLMYEFTPGIREGKPVESTMVLPFFFPLEG